MSSQHSGQAPHLSCGECQQQLQDYLDDGLAKQESMRVFLHVRDCPGCAAELAHLQALVVQLESMPSRTPPTDFDTRVLASVPYESYRAMAGLRAPRIPVFLERESLPAWVRNPMTRLLGAVAAAGVIGLDMAGVVPDGAGYMATIGLVPQALLGLQFFGRKVALAMQQTSEEV